jgi:Ca2+-binding EF-hand superfamily protein
MGDEWVNIDLNATEEELEEIIREVDIDGNGEVDFNEFVLLMSNFFLNCLFPKKKTSLVFLRIKKIC